MKRVISWLLDLLYPPKCVICRRLLAAGETEICADCLEALPNFEGPAPQVDGCDVLCVTLFYEGAVRESFLRFKFSGRDFYADTYGKWMAGTICDKLGTGFDGICWVPVSKKRRRVRGYDQSELLARVIAKKLSLPLVPALQKHAERGPQSQLKDAAQRRSNASGAFSVLAWRIISLLQFGAPDTAQVRRDFAANVAGIMTAAALLLGIILSAKHFGCAVGWGMQFAWLGFIVFMFLIVFVLISVWRGQFPSLTIGCDIISPSKRRLILQFGCGVLAVSLALFCPSWYIKAAFSQVLPGSSIEIAVIMFLAALGLSAPYLLFVAIPSMACYMPFPGRWLRGLKKLALLALWLTLGWLALLLALQCGAGILWRLALLLVVLRLMLYFRRLVFESLEETSSEPQICRIVSLTLNIITVACLLALFGLGWRWTDSLADIRSDEFNQKKLQTLVQRGETVLLKVEADWCLACRYNDFVAFEAPQVQKLLADKRIAVITVNKGQYNPELVRLMQKFGRHNIPFYMVFAPNLPDGVALPRFPTELELRNIFEYLKP